MSLAGEQLREFLLTHNVLGGVTVSDRDFSLSDQSYVHKFGRRFRDLMFALDVRYVPERWDCDNYSLLAAGLTKLDHAKHFSGATDLAVGIVGIATDVDVHRVFGAVHDEGGKLKLRLYEPQPNGVQCLRELQQPPEQFLSCYF